MKTFLTAATGALVALATAVAAADAPKAPPVIEFYVMSKCPYGAEAMTKVKPVLDKLGDAVDFRMYFIGDEPSPGAFTSLHLEPEVRGDLLQVCAIRYAPKRYLELVACMADDAENIPDNFAHCAAEAKVPARVIEACADGEEGKALLSASFKAAGAKGARGSPTMYFGADKFEGRRTTVAFMRAACNLFHDAWPAACKDVPPPRKVALTVLTDARCKDCGADKLVAQLKSMFPGLDAKVLDYGTHDGRALFDSLHAHGLTTLPAFLFAADVDTDPDYDDVRRWLAAVGPYRMLRIGAKWDPTVEICDNGVDDDGNGKTDCDDPGCTDKLVCRKDAPRRLDVFVMSYCPYANRAFQAMPTVLAAFGGRIEFHIHYIVDEDSPGEFTSMHGEDEVAEDIRQLCAARHYAKDDKYLDYVWCRADDPAGDWKACAKGPVKAGVIERCASGREGKALMSADAKVARVLGIGASPTWLANNRHTFSGITAGQIQGGFCVFNAPEAGCNKHLDDQDTPAAGGCGE